MLTTENNHVAKIKKGEIRMNDGWIEWKGGECPVDAGTLIDIRHRDGKKFIKEEALNFSGHAYSWIHMNKCGDIIAYRLHKREFKVGDKVTSLIHGLGKVIRVEDDSSLPVTCVFDAQPDTHAYFTSSGCIYARWVQILYHGHGTFKVEFIPDPEPQFEYQWEYKYHGESGDGIGVTAFYRDQSDMLMHCSDMCRFDFKRRDDTKREVK
jgi:hypothetical protein